MWLRVLRQDYLGLSRLAQYNHKGPFQRDKGTKAQKDVMMWEQRSGKEKNGYKDGFESGEGAMNQ